MVICFMTVMKLIEKLLDQLPEFADIIDVNPCVPTPCLYPQDQMRI